MREDNLFLEETMVVMEGDSGGREEEREGEEEKL
jgi:hypothetical protein